MTTPAAVEVPRLKVPAPVIEPPSRGTEWVPMVRVKPELIFSALACPGATPAPTVREPTFVPLVAFRLTLLLSWTGLFWRLLLPIVTADVLLGADPVDQLLPVSHAFEVLPFQLSGLAACAAAGASAASSAIELVLMDDFTP